MAAALAINSSDISKNLPSAYQQPLIMDNALLQECNVGCILGPSLPDFHWVLGLCESMMVGDTHSITYQLLMVTA